VAASRLLKLGVPVADILKAARRAWKKPDGFNCKQAASLAGFASRFNEIMHELDHPDAPRKPANINQPELRGPGFGNY
jgi:hypothetical protein